MKTRTAIGLGANLGSRTAQILRSRHLIAALPGTQEIAFSSLYETAPMQANGPDYINAVQIIDTALPADELLKHLQKIEAQEQRERPYPNAPRTLDLDLLLYGDADISTNDLTVPHPRMHQRAFVLVPLLQVWPDAIIPGRGAASDYLSAVADQAIKKR
jgi:2-amino-4-hydroxy-6-hydroxymethyldihydropteridine diphosphokinase